MPDIRNLAREPDGTRLGAAPPERHGRSSRPQKRSAIVWTPSLRRFGFCDAEYLAQTEQVERSPRQGAEVDDAKPAVLKFQQPLGMHEHGNTAGVDELEAVAVHDQVVAGGVDKNQQVGLKVGRSGEV